MGLKVGIIGLPNVGKSTLFNAIMGKQAALTAPYPFATIEPNVGVVDVPDERLVMLANVVAGARYKKVEGGGWKLDFEDGNFESLISQNIKTSKNQVLTSKKSIFKISRPPIVPATVTFVDIAGLVKGAAEGDGLGNKFLSHIRDVDLILHVLRDFEADGVPRHQDSKNPVHDAEIVEMELELKDLEVMEKENKENKRINTNKRMSGNKVEKLSNKPVIYAVNIGEDKLANQGLKRSDLAIPQGRTLIYFCAKIEEEIAQLSKIEQKEFMKVYGMETSGLDRIITECFHRLGLISFITSGKIEVKAWPVKKGATAPQAAGAIHSDFEKLFIRAEIIEWEKMAQAGSWQAAKEKGLVRLEGKDYLIKDGDVCNFLIGK